MVNAELFGNEQFVHEVGISANKQSKVCERAIYHSPFTICHLQFVHLSV